jgi:hypothetical protein
MFTVITNHVAAHGSNKGKVTCLTCKLKKCVGRCHFERLDGARAARAAR